VDAAFWLSDGQPSPARAISLTTYWPKENGRPTGGDSDFVVSAYRIEYLPPGSNDKQSLPSQHLRNALVYYLPAPERTEETAYGLTCYRFTRPGVHRVLCATSSDADYDVLLQSDWIGRRPSNPSWQTEIYSKPDGLLIHLRFPEIALPRWADVVCRALTLIRSWEMAPSQTHGG
jgi:hypothetical protein